MWPELLNSLISRSFSMAPFTDRTYLWAHGVCAYSISPHCHYAKKREFICKACWQAASEELQEEL